MGSFLEQNQGLCLVMGAGVVDGSSGGEGSILVGQ